MDDIRHEIFTSQEDGHKNLEYSKELEQSLRKVVEDVLQTVTTDKFTECYKHLYASFEKKDDIGRPSLSGSSKEAKLYKQQLDNIVGKSMEGVIEETLETTVEKAFKELDTYKREQSDHANTTNYWRPPGDAKEHIKPFENFARIQKRNELKSLLDKKKDELETTTERLKQLRQRARLLDNELNHRMGGMYKNLCD